MKVSTHRQIKKIFFSLQSAHDLVILQSMTKEQIEKAAKWGLATRVYTKKGPRLVRKVKVWEVDSDTCAALLDLPEITRGTFGENLVWWQIDEVSLETIEASKALAPREPVPGPKEGVNYFPFQQAGIEFMLARRNTLLADEMGLGKTIQVLGLANQVPGNVLVVCPAFLKLNWANEAHKWLSRGWVIELYWGGGKQTVAPPDGEVTGTLVVINYDILRRHVKHLKKIEWDLLVLDEAHYCKNPKAARTKAAFSLKAHRKVAVTGTPVPNKPIEGYPIFKWLDPVAFGNWKAYVLKYCAAYEGEFGWVVNGASNLTSLNQKLRSTIMLRREKKHVLKDLPSKTYQRILLEGYVPEHLRMATKEEREKIRQMVLEEDMTIQQAYAAIGKQEFLFESGATRRRELGELKVEAASQHCRIAAESHPIVVFGVHRTVITELVERLKGDGLRVAGITGTTSQYDRSKIVQQFQDGKLDIVVGNIQAMGVGLTLTRSSHVIFVELDWVPGNMRQAEDRCHRIGQKGNVLVQHLVYPDTLDSIVSESLLEKSKNIKQITK